MLKIREKLNKLRRPLRRFAALAICLSMIIGAAPIMPSSMVHALEVYETKNYEQLSFCRELESSLTKLANMSLSKRQSLIRDLADATLRYSLTDFVEDEDFRNTYYDNREKIFKNANHDCVKYGRYYGDFLLIEDWTTYRRVYYLLYGDDYDYFMEYYMGIKAQRWWDTHTLEDKKAVMDYSASYHGYMPNKDSETLKIALKPCDIAPEMELYINGYAYDAYDLYTVKASSVEVEYYRFEKDPTNALRSEVKDSYLLRVDTGVLGGNNVLYLGVKYKDDKGIERTEFLFPHENSLNDGYRMAEAFSSPVGRQNTIYGATDYQTTNTYGNSEGLTPYSSDMYLFNPRYKMAEFKGIDVFLRYPMDGVYTKGWTCNGIYMYSVEEVYGVQMAGYYSGTYNIGFKGTLMGYLADESVDFELEGSDILYKISNEAGSDYKFEVPAADAASYDSQLSDYLIKLDIADKSGAGIESLAALYNDGYRIKQIAEALAVTVKYKDFYGKSRTVVMPAITSMVGWMVEEGMVASDLPIAGIAQQGENIMFPASLPDFKSLESVSLNYGDEAAEAAGVTATQGVTRNNRIKALANDSMAITGMQIYGNDVTVSYSAGDASIRLSANGSPLYYYVANDSDGKSISTGKTEILMSEYKTGASLTPVDQIGGSHYILVIKTDDMTQAGTSADLTVRVGYEFTDGKVYETKDIDLHEAAEDFFGYWPCADGKNAAAASLSPGMEIIAELPITHANKFTSVTISMDSRSLDDWQMKELAIYSVDSIGNRTVEWNKPAEGDQNMKEFLKVSDRIITRDFERSGDTLVTRYPTLLDISEAEAAGEELDKVYLGGNVFSETIYFSENSTSDIGENKPVDWEAIRYSMSYKESLQDLGFSNRDSIYEVDVKVASNSESNSNDGDCGSQNLFYFKLIFENGNSGYVLANQQLSADGFRADRTETFYIATNEDMGALTAVSIISEDNSGSTNQDVFDKLKISYIDVIKVSDEALSKSWRIDNVGWIDINYMDKGAEESTSGRPGRTEAEIAQVKTVTSKGYSVNLLFVLSTGSYARGENDTNISASSNNPQFQGSAVATIEYYDSSGALRKKSIDMVSAMYEYANRKPETYEELFKDSEDSTAKRARSNDEFMFRANHNDRFIVSLNDAKQIVRVRFGMRSEVTTTWKLNKVSIYQITGAGNLQITSSDEYKRTNKVEFLCESKDDIGYKLKVFQPDREYDTLGEEQSLPVLFTDHSLNVNINGGKWSSSITKKPESKYDSLNVYVYMKGNPTDTPMSEFDMQANVQWHTNYPEQDRADSIGPLNKDLKNNMFYYVGLRTIGLDSVKAISLKGSSRNLILADIDHVIIQHVRSDVTIETYYADFTGVSAEYEHTSKCVTLPEVEDKTFKESQTANIFFGEGTETFDVIKDKQDLAVAISYKTVNDSVQTGIGYTYRSAYVFLSELTDASGNLLYPQIKPGSIVKIPFKEPFISEITGMTLVAVGDINVHLDSAYVTTADNGGNTNGWYSFGIDSDILGIPYNATPTVYQNVTPLKVVFQTNSDARIVSSGTDDGQEAAIRMIVDYTDLNTGGRESLIINDLRKYLTSGDFKVTEDGNTAVVEIFAKNIGSIRSIKLEPYAGGIASSAMWGISTVSAEVNSKGTIKSSSVTLNHEEMVGGVKTIVPGKTAAEGTPLIVNMSSVYEILEVSYYDAVQGITNKPQSEINGTVKVSVPDAVTFTITPKIVGTLDGYGFTTDVMRLVNGTLVPAKGATISKDKVVFTPEANTSTDPVTYVITCYSEEVPSICASAQITIAGKPKAEETGGGGNTPSSGGETTPEENNPAENNQPEETPQSGPEAAPESEPTN